MNKFINKNKKTYENLYVLYTIKSNILFNQNIDDSIKYYNDKSISTQFFSLKFDKFEIVVINNIKGIKSGFYILDEMYSKFQTSSFIQKKLFKSHLKHPKNFINNDAKINKYFIEYIKNNTILYYDFDNYINEFKTILPSNNNLYQPKLTLQYNPHFKSPHSVNGHWRNQPYGSKGNKIYKRIWIEEFEKGAS